MQNNGQLHHSTYIILVLGIEVIILHTKLSLFLNPCQVTLHFVFHQWGGSRGIANHVTNLALNFPCSQEQWYGEKLHAVHWRPTCAHWDSLGTAACIWLLLGEYRLPMCPLDIHVHLQFGFELNWSQNSQYPQTFHTCSEGIL